MKIAFPPVVDPGYARGRYRELANSTDAEVVDYWNLHGEAEGLVFSPAALRENFIPLAQGKILEVGPFCSPAYLGDNVSYLDVLSSEELKSRAVDTGQDPSRCPNFIHYNAISEVDKTFDVVFSSHNIEHQPDLLGHLRELSAVVDPQGAIMMLVPDKRYCFDHFLSESTIADVLDAQGRTRHTLKSVVEHLAMTSHNDSLRYWSGDPGPAPDPLERLAGVLALYEKMQSNYLDVHAWQFTPRSFLAVLEQLFQIGASPLRPFRVYNTPHGRLEFAAVLTR